MDARILETIVQKLGDAVSFRFPEMVRRDAEVTALPGKARAVIGMRQTGMKE